MRTTQRVLVVGAGIGGLAAAAAFGQRGVDVDVIEIRPAGSGLGVGLTQTANALRELRTIGALQECLLAGYQYDRLRFYDQRGKLVVECPSRFGGDGVPAYNGISRPVLQGIMTATAERAGARIRYGLSLSDLVQHSERVDVAFSDDQTGSYDLVLGFDGINSPLRRHIYGVAHEPRYTGYGVWRMPLPRAAEITGTAIYQAPHAKVGVVPASETSMYLFCLSREPGSPRHDAARYADLLRERLRGYTGLVGDIRDGLVGAAGIVYNPLSEVLVPPPWWKGRVVILGDAAHACTPHLSQGGAMALEDAILLAEMLVDGAPLTQTLDFFMQRRYPRVKLVQDASRAVLDAEMRITADNIADALGYLRANLPAQLAQVEAVLNQPA